MRHLMPWLAVLAALTSAGLALAVEFDAAAEAEDLSVAGETVQQAGADTAQAMRTARFRPTISTVGFDIPAGSEAERSLQETAQIGGGAYFTANNSGELAAALGAAASGRTSVAALGAVTLQKPRDGDVAGPSIEVAGKAAPEAVVVVFTVVINAQTGAKLRTVPGIRHRPEADGSFTFRVATPRVSFGGAETPPPLTYEVHVHTVRADGSKGPETIVKLREK